MYDHISLPLNELRRGLRKLHFSEEEKASSLLSNVMQVRSRDVVIKATKPMF